MISPRTKRLMRPLSGAVLPAPAATAGQGSDERANRRDAEWLGDARWHYEMHDKRSNSAQTRAAPVMAFSGALLALIPHLVTTDASQITSARILFVVTAVLAVTAASLAAATLWPRTGHVSEIRQIREQWQQYRHDSDAPAGDRNHQAAENLLGSADPAQCSPLESIRGEADSRMKTLGYAYLALGAALVGTAALAVQQVLTTGGNP